MVVVNTESEHVCVCVCACAVERQGDRAGHAAETAEAVSGGQTGQGM